jgi:hypothetical protein
MPRRLQLSRKKGWRKPPNSVVCTRPGPLGNPFRVDTYGHDVAVQMFDDWIEGRLPPSAEAPEHLRQRILALIPTLRDKDYLLCWCPRRATCHCDTYIRRANT